MVWAFAALPFAVGVVLSAFFCAAAITGLRTGEGDEETRVVGVQIGA